MNKTRMGKRAASLLLSLVMMLSLLPTAAYAAMADGVDTQGAIVSENGTGVSDDSNSSGNTDDLQVGGSKDSGDTGAQQVGGSSGSGTADDTTGAEGGADPTDSVNGNDSADPQDGDGAVTPAATNVAKVGNTEYATLNEAIAALGSSSYTLELLDESVWEAATPVYWAAGSESSYAATLAEALTAAYKANAGAITIVCRPGADVGELTHGHVADDITIYGNNAYISGGECDLEVDTYTFSRDTGKQVEAGGAYLEKDITVTAYELDNLGVWGQRHSDHKVTVNLTDCDSTDGITVQRVYISGTTGVNDITLTGCDFGTKATSVYSNADGAVVIDNCSFTGAQVPVNFNHKANGTQTVAVQNSTFTNCGDNGDWEQFAAPVRFVNSGSGTMDTTVNTCTFTDTVGSNGDILLGDGRVDQNSNDVALTVESTKATVQAQQPGYYGKDGTTDESKQGTKNVAAGDKLTTSVTQLMPSETTTYVAEVKGVKYETLQAAIDAAAKSATVTLLADTRENVTISTYGLTLDLNGHTLNGGTVAGKPALTVKNRVTVKDSSAAQTGTIMREDTAANSGVSSHYVIDIQDGWLFFESGSVTNNSGVVGVKGASLVRVGDDSVAKYPGLTISGGTFTQDNFIVIKVDRGTFYLKEDGTLNSKNSYAVENWKFAEIKGGTVNGTVAAWTYSGGHNSDLTISGGTVNGNVLSVNYGSAEGKVAKVSITGGTVNGALDTRSYDPSTNELTSIDDATKATIAVTGGTFSSDPTKYVVEDSAINKNDDGTFGVAKAYLAKVGDTSYYTMDEAFKAQTASGEAIVMLRDYTTGSTFNSGTIARTVDLNGHTWTCTGTDANSAAFEINNPNATLTVKNGKVVSSQLVGLIPSAMGGTIKYDNSSLEFDGVEMTTTAHSGIETNGNNTNDTVKLVNSELNVPNGFGIYFPSSGTLTIDNSVINAKTMGVQVCSGSLNISGAGTAITVTGDGIAKTENDGAIEDGAAISIVNRTGYKGLIAIKVESGTFTAKAGNDAVKAYKWDNTNKTESAFDNSKNVVAVSGGTFSSAVDKSLCAGGFIPTQNADGTYGVKEGKYVAEIGSQGYDSLQAAIDAASRNAIVTLLADTRENVTIDKMITLDLNGHTLNGGTEKGKPALTVTARVTVKDSSAAQTGTIMREDTAANSGVSSHYVIDVQGAGWLTFESGSVKNNSGNDSGKGASLVRVGDDSVDKYPGLNIKGGTFTQDNFIVIKVDSGDLFLNGGTLNSANSYAIEDWHRATIKGGTVNGTVAVWTYNGGHNSDLTISGGTVNGNVASVSYDKAEGKLAKVSISGGTVNGTLGTYTYGNGLIPIDDAAKATIEVTGGTFSEAPTKYVVEDSAITPNADGTYGVAKAYLAKVGNTSYYTMDEAFKAQTASGEAIVLLRDYTTGSTFNSGSIARTVDLAGHTWTCTGTDANSAAFEINYPDASLTVKNGKVFSSQLVGLIPSAMGGTIKYDNSSLVFDGVEMTTTARSGIETNGNNTNDTVTLKDSTLNVPNGFGIYFPSSGTLTIDNSVINAKTMGVQVCVGSLNVTGAGTAINVSGDGIPKTINDGAIEDGAAISIVNRAGYKDLAEIKVEGGKFTAKGDNAAVKAYDWANQTENAFTQSDKVSISGGTFSSAVDKSLCADGYIPSQNADGTYSVKEETRGTEARPYTLAELGVMTRAEYVAAQEALGGTMYVAVGNYTYDKNGVLGNGERNDTPGQNPDHSKLNAYGENGYLNEKNDGANGKNIVFVNGSITSGATGYTSIDDIGTSLLLAVPAYTNVTFKGITFNNVMSFNYQLYTSPWSQLGELKFDGCTFNGIIVGAIAAQTLTFNGCTFTNYTNTTKANSSNPTWIRPAYGNWTAGDNKGQGDNFRSLTKINFTGNTVTSTRPVKFEYISQWDIRSTVTVTNNSFDISAQKGDTEIKNVGLYLGAHTKTNAFDLVADGNTKSDNTAALYTIPKGETSLPLGSTVTNTNGDQIELVDALKWKAADAEQDKIVLKTVKAVASVDTVNFATLAEAIGAAQDGQTVTLLADATEDVVISKSITLDLGGKTLTNTNAGKATISVTSGTVTVKNGNVVGGNDYYNIEVTKGSNANLTLTDVAATAGNTGSSMIDNWGTLTITSGTYTGGLNVVKSEEGSVLNISGGTFTRETAPRWGITGTVLVYGTTTITGGTFNEKSTSTNARVVVTGRVDGYDSITYVKGGTFNGNGNNVFHHLSPAQADDSFEVSGGTFNKSIPDYYCADGFIPTKNAGGTYGVKEGSYVAKIGSKKYETLADAIKAAQDGKTVRLLADVEQNTQLTINKSITLDLNGKTIKNTMDIWGDNANAILSIKNGAKVTITGNGTIDAKENDCYTINVVKGDLTIENGTFYGNVSVVQMEEGTLSVKGGTFDLHQKWEGSSKYLFNCIDSEFTSGNAKVAISGGTFVGFDPNVSPEQKVDGKAPSFAAPGTGITRNADGSFTAVDGMTAQILDKDGNSVKAYRTLAEAVAAAEDGQTVRLLADVTLDAQIATGKAITIDGQSKYTIRAAKLLVSADNKAGMFYRTGSANGTLTFLNVTLDGNGVSKIFLNEGGAGETVFDGVTSTNGGGWAYGSGIHISGGGSHATIRNSTLTGSTGTMELNDTNYYAANDLWVGGNVYVTVENSVIGTVFVNSAPSATATNGVVHGQLTITGESTKITYLSGEEESADKLDKFGNNGSLVKIDSGYVEKVFDKGSYAISGGTFKTKVEKEWCAAGYVPTQNGDGTYGVEVGKFTVMVTSRTTGSDSPVANVAGGGSNITYAQGTTVTASAISGYKFVGWFVNEYTGTPYSTDLSCAVKPTADCTMIAVYEPISGGKFWLTVTASEFTVNGGAVQDSYLYEQFAIGTSVTVEFTGSENFLYWVNASNKVVSTDKSYTFIMGSETTLKAVYGKTRQNQATVVFISHSDQIISSKAYTTSDTIQFPVPPIKMGCTFTGWSMTESEIRAAMANNSGIIQVRARYTEPSIACKVTVIYPEGIDNEAVNAVVGKAINVTAKDIEGKTFSYWTDDKGTVLGYTKTLKLAPSGDMTVKAVYGENAEVKPVISMTAIDASAGNGYWVVSFTATRAVPAGYEMVKQGILYSLDSRCAGEAGKDYLKLTADGTVPEGVYEYSGKDQALNGVTRFNGKVGTADTTLYGRGYMILKNSAGEVLYVYADTILSGSYNSLKK